MKEQPDFSLGAAVGEVIKQAGKDISDTTLGALLGELYPEHAKGTRWRVTLAQVRHVSQYWAEWGGLKIGRPTIQDWGKAHFLAIPPCYVAPLPAVVAQPAAGKAEPGDDRKTQNLMRKIAREEAEKIIAERVGPAKKQITESMKAPRASDPRVDRIIQKVKAFAMKNPATIDAVWNYLYKRFQEAIGVKIETQKGQNAFQWIRAEGHLDEFELLYVDHLAEYEDVLVGQPRLGA